MADKKKKKKSNFKDEFRGIIGVNPRLNPAVTAAALEVAGQMTKALTTVGYKAAVMPDNVRFVGRCRRLGSKSSGANLFTVESVVVILPNGEHAEVRRNWAPVGTAVCAAVADYMRLYCVKPPKTTNSWGEYGEAALQVLHDAVGFWAGAAVTGRKEVADERQAEPHGAGDKGHRAATWVPAGPVA